MSKSNYLESKIVQHVINAAAYTAPATLYLALYTSDPTEADTGTEATGGSPAYARKSISFGTEANGTVANSNTITFNTPTATITHWGIRDASSGGNLLYYGAFDIPISTTSGGTLVVAIGDLSITED